MDAVIEADANLGSLRNHACETTSLSLTIQSYTNGLEALDYSSCPPDFEEGFRLHIQAWKDLIPLVTPYDSLRGEMHDLFAIIEQQPDSIRFIDGVDEVWSTWALIEKAMEE